MKRLGIDPVPLVLAGLAATSGLLWSQPATSEADLILDDTNLRFGVAGARGQILDHGWFVTNYCSDWRIPYWSSYVVYHESLFGDEERKDSFFQEDIGLEEEHRSTREDYVRSGLDRGHLAPAASFKRDHEAYVTTFLLSNMSPQYPASNRHIQGPLEDQIRRLVTYREGKAWVVTGNTFLEDDMSPADPDTCYWIGEDDVPRVAIPTHLFTAVLLEAANGEYAAYGFLVPNVKNRKGMRPVNCRMPVDSVEKYTGWDFFPVLDDTLEDRIEGRPFAWDW